MARRGLDALRAIISGEAPVPPMAHTLGLRLTEVGHGHAVLECEIGMHLLNPFGVVYGGLALTLVDTAAGCAVHACLEPGIGYTSIETKVNFTRPILADVGVARVTGRILSLGRRIATAEASVHDPDGQLLAHGTSTVMLVKDGSA